MANDTNLPSYHQLMSQLLRATAFSYVLTSPITPTDWIGKKIAPACHTFSYKPSSIKPFIKIWSTSWRILIFSELTSPSILIAKPGPGKGCLFKIWFGKFKDLPTLLTSSLKSDFKGSIILISYNLVILQHYDEI